MIYKFIVLSDEESDFLREISIDAESTFLDLNNAILDSVGYTRDQMTSFFETNNDWEKEKEIALVDMGMDSEYEVYLMDEITLRDENMDKGQRLLFEFDNISERYFFVELQSIVLGKELDKPECTKKKGKAPKQMIDIDVYNDSVNKKSGKKKTDTSFDDMYGDETGGFDNQLYDDEELGDLNDDINLNDDYNY